MISSQTAAQAVECVGSGDRVFLHSAAVAPYVEPEYGSSFRLNSLFVGANVREAVQAGRADYVPIFLSEAPGLFRQNLLPLDVALVSVSLPDLHGYCSLGVSVDISLAAVQTARRVVAQVNRHMPRTHGDGHVHISRFHAVIEGHEPLPEHPLSSLSDQDVAIGRHVAGLVEDGATLQMGIGAIPDAVLSALGGHQRLGVHTEMFAEGLIPLVEKGVVTGEMKRTRLGSGSSAGRIVPYLKPGAGVVTTRAHVHFVVTELGVAQLHGRNLRQRAEALAAIAHPSHRDALDQETRRRFGRR